jgi:hypothetical protein
VVATTGTDGFTIDRFNLRQNTASSVPAAMQWDELRIGTTWSAVTPPAPPLLTHLSFSNGAFRFEFTNGSAQTYSVYASPNLADWIAVGAASPVAPGLYQFTDLDATNAPQRFYQLRAP